MNRRIKNTSFKRLTFVNLGIYFVILPSDSVYWVYAWSSIETRDSESKFFAWISKNSSSDSPYSTFMYPSFSKIFRFNKDVNNGRAIVGDKRDNKAAVCSNIYPPVLLKVE